MSNPAVIILASSNSRTSRIRRFAIEDNIGESIHIHINEFRFDFSIDEFLIIADFIREALVDLDFLKGGDLQNFDENFLCLMANHIERLESFSIEEIPLSELKCIHRYKVFDGLHFSRLVSVAETAATRYLNRDDSSFINYPQDNYRGVSNVKRLDQVVQSVRSGYPKNGQRIVLFNGQNIVMDGQHRASALFHLYGPDEEISILRLTFVGKRHYYNALKSNSFQLVKWIVRWVRVLLS